MVLFITYCVMIGITLFNSGIKYTVYLPLIYSVFHLILLVIMMVQIHLQLMLLFMH